MKKLFLSVLLSFSLFGESYSLGEGVKVGDEIPFYLGGYFSLNSTFSEGSQLYELDDLAFLGYGESGAFSYLGELEFHQLYTEYRSDERTISTSNRSLYIERLYLGYEFNDLYSIKVGKYNSPVGFYNLMPINVLRATTSMPHLVEIIFPQFMTGIYLKYDVYNENELEINCLFQEGENLSEEYSNFNTNRYYALGIAYLKESLSFKFDSGYFSNEEINTLEDNRFYLQLSSLYESDKVKLMAEVAIQFLTHQQKRQYAGFIESIYRVKPEHDLILRLESFKEYDKRQYSEVVVGYTYRPLYPVALKTEYQYYIEDDDMNQVVFSLSVLF